MSVDCLRLPAQHILLHQVCRSYGYRGPFPYSVGVDSARIDQWVWAVRLYRTRSLATEACRGGHIRLNGKTVKAATPVTVGDRIRIRSKGGERDLEVTQVIAKRVGAPIAATCFIDHSPPLARAAAEPEALFAVRERGAGKPTKRERRQLDRLRGRGR